MRLGRVRGRNEETLGPSRVKSPYGSTGAWDGSTRVRGSPSDLMMSGLQGLVFRSQKVETR